jgi:hypothetical protein
MSEDLEAAGGALALMKLGLMHPDNLHPDANAIVPFVDPATLDPMADEDQPGYISTIDVIRMVRPHRDLEYIRQRAGREGYKQFGETDKDSAFDDCVAVEMACREILNANRWMLAAAGAQTPGSPPA